MVDIDAEAKPAIGRVAKLPIQRAQAALRLPGFSAGIAASSGGRASAS
jgi:hypothetical protein